MRFAERHVAMAKFLAERPQGVTAKELAKFIKRSERLAAAIIQHVRAADTGYDLVRRGAKKDRPGPSPQALVIQP